MNVHLTDTQCLRYILLLLLSSFSVSILIFYVEQKNIKKLDCHVDSVTAEGGWKVSIKVGFY